MPFAETSFQQGNSFIVHSPDEFLIRVLELLPAVPWLGSLPVNLTLAGNGHIACPEHINERGIVITTGSFPAGQHHRKIKGRIAPKLKFSPFLKVQVHIAFQLDGAIYQVASWLNKNGPSTRLCTLLDNPVKNRLIICEAISNTSV